MGKDEIKTNKKNIFIMLVSTTFTVMYLVWRILYTIPVGKGGISMTAGIVLFAVETLGLVESLIHYYNLHDLKAPKLPQISEDEYPEVDIFIATYNEPAELLKKTINGCKHMKYPDLSKVHIYICDDGHREQIKELAASMNVGYFDREDNKGAKAGNLNNALFQTKSPYIVTFDADMIPRSEFLLKTIPYCIDTEKKGKHIGFVQSPQAFYNPDLFQYFLYAEKNIPNEQDYFYRDIQVSRNKSNCPIYGGSNTVLSRRALEDIGGFYTETITEDFATGILIQKKGYICIATPEVLASGLSATDLKSLINQRIRWGRGVISTDRKLHILRDRDLTLAQKINYWASIWYWYSPIKRLVYFMSPLLYGAFGFTVVDCTLLQIIVFWLPMYVSQNLALRIMSHNIRNSRWTAIYETILFPFLLYPIILEAVGISMTKFKVTDKRQALNDGKENRLFAIPFLILCLLSAFAIIRCVFEIFESNSLGVTIVLFWLINNFYTLAMSAFFMIGRPSYRKYDRMYVKAEAVLYTNTERYNCFTKDISEGGLSVVFNEPVNIDNGNSVTIDIYEEEYCCSLKCKLLHAEIIDSREYKYSFKIIDFLDTYEDYLQIIYDRVPTLPQELNRRAGIFDDLKNNIANRTKKITEQKRTMPRLELNCEIKDKEGQIYTIMDFNYKYLTIKKDKENAEEYLELPVCDHVMLNCRVKETRPDENILYEITNFKDIIDDRAKNHNLEKWVAEKLLDRFNKEMLVTQSSRKYKRTTFNEIEYLT